MEEPALALKSCHKRLDQLELDSFGVFGMLVSLIAATASIWFERLNAVEDVAALDASLPGLGHVVELHTDPGVARLSHRFHVVVLVELDAALYV